jgi:hypothetical protein
MAREVDTPLKANEFYSRIFRTLAEKINLPIEKREEYLTSFKKMIADEVYGMEKGALLTNTDKIEFIDDPSTAGGFKSHLTKQAWKDALREIQLTTTDERVLAELKGMGKGKTLGAIRDLIVEKITKKQAALRVIQLQKIAQDQKAFVFYAKDLSLQITSKLTPQKVLKDLVNLIETSKEKLKTVSEAYDKLNDVFKTSTQLFTYEAIYIATRNKLGPVPAILGIVPIKNAHEVEVARSGKILKFRATGSVFLAGQQGGDQTDAIRIEGVLKPEDHWIMFPLWALFLYGQSKFKDMDSLLTGEPLMTEDGLMDVRKMNNLLVQTDPTEKPSYEYHQTFPFITRHFIIPNCYIETISIENKLPKKDVLQYSILLRTYAKPKGAVKWMSTDKKAKKNSVYGFVKKTQTQEICDLSLSTAWRALMTYGWIINENEWKIGSASNPNALDTYYDVDWTTVCSAAYLNLMGAVV